MNNATHQKSFFSRRSWQSKWLPLLFCLCSLANATEPEDKKNKKQNEPGMEELLDMESFKLLADALVSSSTGGILTKLSAAPNTIRIFDASEIARLNAYTVSDVLKTVAGVQVQMKSNGREKIWIRGSQSEFNNKIALYVDGIPYRNVFGGFPIDEEIPIESIASIEIIRGPGSALYGANAFSGVINIRTFWRETPKDDADKDSNGKARKNYRKNRIKAGVGQRDTALAYVSLGHEFKGIAKVMLEGKWWTSDGRKPRFDSTGEANHRTGDQDLNHLRFKASAFDDELRFSASYNKFENSRVDRPFYRDNLRKNENLRFSLAYEHRFNEMWKVDFNAYYTRTERREFENTYQRVNGERGGLAESFEFVDTTEMTGGRLAVNMTPSKYNDLLLGMEYKRERLAESKFFDNLTGEQLTFVEDPDYQKLALNTYSFFIQARQNLSEDDSTQFTAGLRFDRLDLFSDQFSYRFGLTHAFDENFYIKLLYGTAYREPNFVEFTRAPTGSTLPDVETMETAEIQFGYQSDEFRADLTFYYNQYNDYLFRKNSFHENSQNLNSGVFSNIDDIDIFGVDFESKFKFNDNLSGFLNVGWTNARSEGQEQLMPLLTNWTVAAGLDWQMDLYGGKLHFNNHMIGYAARKDWSANIWEAGQQQRYDNRSDEFNDGYIVWNTGLHYERKFGDELGMRVDLTVHNLLDTEYYTQSLTPPRSNRVANFDTQYPGRHGRLSVTLSF